jgi:endonuclease/exonuclease/phosphatase family metal-dependent hydrolase
MKSQSQNSKMKHRKWRMGLENVFAFCEVRGIARRNRTRKNNGRFLKRGFKLRFEMLEERTLLASLATNDLVDFGTEPMVSDSCSIVALSMQSIQSNELRLNEIKANPPGSTTAGDKFQYIEIAGTAGLSLSNVYLVMIDGNSPTLGIAKYVANLSGFSVGSNGLFMMKSPTGGHSAASGTTVFTDTLFETPGGILSKLSVTFMLVSATGSFVQGSDYDSNNDGELDSLPAGFAVIDNVGWSDGDVGDRVYGGVALTQTQGTPDAASRIVGSTVIAKSAWFNGDLYDVGNLPSQTLYDATRGSTNLPISPNVASITPGASNFVAAQTSSNLRVVSYNIASAESPGLPRSGLDTILQAIGTEIVGGVSRAIDLLALQEVFTQSTTTAAVASLLNTIYGAGVYATGTLNGSSTGGGTVGVVYNTQTLQLLAELGVGTVSTSGQPRQTVRHHFQPIGGGTGTDFYVYNSHWKAVDDQEGRDRRLVEAQAIRANADALGNGKNILYVGDFNVYAGSELAFQTMLGVGNGQASDPVNRIGNWNNNASFIDVFTQAPAVNPPGLLVGGGLDDRFDFQLVTGEFTDGTGIDYRPGSYHSFGNNASVPINSSINNSSSTALSGLANRTTVLDLLTTVTDHLPVVADYTVSTVVNQPAVRFNEVLVNPSDADDSREFIELLRLIPSETLSDVWLIELETDSATARGTVDHALNLSTALFGSNNLLLIGDNYQTSIPYSNVPAATGRFNLSRPSAPGIENSANLLLVSNFTGTIGVDYDANNDGILDSTPWAALLDFAGTKVLNSDNSGVVDAIVRLPGNIAASSSASFYGGEILDTGTSALDLQFQAAPLRTANFPSGGILTPGFPNAPKAMITSRSVFYNNSTGFGTSGSNNAPSVNPINAIDPTRIALLPGATTSTSNYTNYSRGLNGIVVDLNSPGNLGGIDASSFQFAAWSNFSNASPNFLTINPTVTVSTFPTGGIGGSGRIKLVFADHAIENAWLQITVVADVNTGLASNDIFYFGNARLDVTPVATFPTQVAVNIFDVNQIRAQQGLNSGIVSNLFDLDRNGVVNIFDTNATRAGQGMNSLRPFTASSSQLSLVASVPSIKARHAIKALQAFLSELGSDSF